MDGLQQRVATTEERLARLEGPSGGRGGSRGALYGGSGGH
jgi:hypothetical protein